MSNILQRLSIDASRCVEGPDDWRGTQVTYALTPRADGGTTLLFSHEGWATEREFTGGEISRWD